MAKTKKASGTDAPSGARACVLVAIEIDGVKHQPYTVVDLTPEQLETYAALGAVDASPDSVAYAESLEA
jgi:hypothetical protein